MLTKVLSADWFSRAIETASRRSRICFCAICCHAQPKGCQA
jgi:hypothetical protein